MKPFIIDNIDIELLKEQRNFLLEKFEMGNNDLIDGLINFLDDCIDKEEGED